MDPKLIKDVADIVIKNIPDVNIDSLNPKERERYNIALNAVAEIKAKEFLTAKDMYLYEFGLDTLTNFMQIENKETAVQRMDTAINIAVAVAGITAQIAAPGSGAIVGQIATIAGEFAKETY